MPGESVRPGREQPNPGRPAFAGVRGEATAGEPCRWPIHLHTGAARAPASLVLH